MGRPLDMKKKVGGRFKHKGEYSRKKINRKRKIKKSSLTHATSQIETNQSSSEYHEEVEVLVKKKRRKKMAGQKFHRKEDT